MFAMHAALLALATSGTGQTILLDFYSDHCPPCRMMDPLVKQMIAQGYPVRQVNVEQDAAMAARFNVQRWPCFIMLVNGGVVDRAEGIQSAQRLVQMCRMALPPPDAAAVAQSPAPFTPAPAEFVSGPTTRPPVVILPAQPAERPYALPSPAPVAESNPAGPGRSDAELIAVTVRLRIEDPSGWSCGSGTLIDAREGQALILTCGHIFRDSKGKGRIEVDLFSPNAAERVPGTLIGFDVAQDVGLVSIRISRPVSVAPVASEGYVLRPGDAIATVGCSNGDAPTVRRTRVTALERYQGQPYHGLPNNVEVADVPVVGRSGGGLFTPDGLVVGVCNAADPPGREGLYAGLGLIHAALDRAGQSALYCQRSTAAPNAPAATVPAPLWTNPAFAPAPAMLAVAPLISPPPMGPLAVTEPGGTPLALSATTVRLAAEEQAFLEEVHRRATEGSEVIFVVRPGNDAQARSEVVPLEQAWATLMGNLAASSGNDPRNPAAADPTRQRPPTEIRPGGREVVCIVRPRGNPQSRSEVVILDNASQALLDKLAVESRDNPHHLSTSLQIPADGGR